MTPSIVLKRTVKVEAWRVIGQIAKTTKRPELMPMLLRIQDQVSSDAHDIAQHLLFEGQSRLVVAERLLKIGELYGLLGREDSDFFLTEEGEQTLRSDEVFVPEYGTWTIWATDDPLLDSPIIAIEPWEEPNAYDEVWGKKKEEAKTRTFKKLPNHIKGRIGLVQKLRGSAGQQMRIDSLEEKGEFAPEDQRTITLEWDITNKSLRLEGMGIKTQLPVPKVSAQDAWMQLLQGVSLHQDWDSTHSELKVSFAQTTEVEKTSMTRTLEFPAPAITPFGSFEHLKVPRVTITAVDSKEATEWAVWRLESKIDDYATQTNFARWVESALEPFIRFGVKLENRSTMAQRFWKTRGSKPSAKAWHLTAAEDWRLS